MKNRRMIFIALGVALLLAATIGLASVTTRWQSNELTFRSGSTNIIAIPDGANVTANARRAPSVLAINPQLAFYFVDDFLRFEDDGSNSINGWTLTAVETGISNSTVMSQGEANFDKNSTGIDGTGGVIKLDSDGYENDGLQIQMLDEDWKLATGKDAYFECRVQITEATQSDFFVGLAVTDTSVIGSYADGVGFKLTDGSAITTFETVKDSNLEQSQAIAATAVDTWYRLGFLYDGATTITPYVNGAAGTAHTTFLPNNEAMRLTLAWLNGTTNMQNDGMFVDYCYVLQVR